jgi:hypothetical protein
MNPASTVRDGMIAQAQQERIERDVKIMQKVNAAHRESFKARYPGQIEHCMRLTAERLQAVLTRKPAELSDPATWTATADEIAKLSEALWHLSVISQVYPMESEDDEQQ